MATVPQTGIHLIAAMCKKFGIGQERGLPWHIPEDLKKFNSLTLNNVVVMGRITYESLPNSKRPLPDRLNVILTSTPKLDKHHDVIEVDLKGLMPFVSLLSKQKAVWIIGGEQLFRMFMTHQTHFPTSLWLTQIDKQFECDTRFPLVFSFGNYALVHHDKYRSESEDCICRNLLYTRTSYSSMNEKEYTYLLKDVMERGTDRVERTGVGTRALFGKTMRFDLRDGFPILTTKFVSWRIVIEELLWFLRGETDSKLLEEKKVDIWKQNTSASFIRDRGLSWQDGEVGGMYGYVWRHGGHKFSGNRVNHGEGKDQLLDVIDLLKNDPYSRRIIMTSNDVTNLETGVLYPCHGLLIQFYVEDVDGTKHLSCSMTQRSADCFLGLPINIASYAALTHILAAKTDMIAKELIINTNDTHIYHNHMPQVTTQLKRTLLPLPKLVLSENVKTKSFEELTGRDFDLAGYWYHPALKGLMAV